MDAQRHQEIAELQRAHESLANTKAELVQSSRKLKEAQDRARELERQSGGGPAHRSSRRGERGLLPEAPAEMPAAARGASMDDEPPPSREGQPEEPAAASDEPLSLRERLARAAAARHRPSGTSG
jgi:hypothetical protein